MVPSQATPRRKVGHVWLLGLVVVLVTVLVVAILVIVNNRRQPNCYQPRTHMQDSDFTLKYDGFLWGDWQVDIDDGIYAIGTKIDTLVDDPQDYDPAQNERIVRIGNLPFVNPQAEGPSPGCPSKVRVDLSKVNGMMDTVHMLPSIGSNRGAGIAPSV